MHATKVLQKILSPVIAGLDVRNARNLFFAVEALLVGRRLTLTELARHFPGADRIHAPLKRLDRLLGKARCKRCAYRVTKRHFCGCCVCRIRYSSSTGAR